MRNKKYKPKVTKKLMNDMAHDAISEMANILHKMGKIDEATLKEYDITTPTVKILSPKEIKNIRETIKLSQPVFAKLLNISPETVKKWEQGDRHPTGASLKLLNLVYEHGVQVLY